MPRKARAVGIKLMKAQELYGHPLGPVELARLCDELGVDEVHVSDHVVMTAEGHRGREGFPYPVDYDGWYEPMALLSAIAAVTEHVGLSSHVVVAPLRPAVLLAKQIATLDVLSGGRARLGLGVGWQRQEFEAAGMPFDRRLTRLVEQVEACRALWTDAPATFHGATVSFDDAYSLPLPPQGAAVPLSFGVPAGPRAFAEIARLGVGYCPANAGTGDLATNIATARAAYRAAGRDPESLVVTAELTMNPARDASGRVDWDAVFAEGRQLLDAGADVLITHVVPHCDSPADVRRFIERLLDLRE